MNMHLKRELAVQAFRLWEGLAFILAMWLSATVVPGAEAPIASETITAALTTVDAAVLACAAIAWVITLSALGLYSSRRSGGLSSEIIALVIATTLIVGGFVVVGGVFDLPYLTPSVLASFWLLNIAICFFARLCVRSALTIARRLGRNLRFVMIIGAGRRAQYLARQIAEDVALGYRVIGLVDDDIQGSESSKFRNLGSIDSLPRLLATQVVDEVFIALPIRSRYDDIHRALRACEMQGVPARLFTDFFDADGIKSQMAFLASRPTLRLYKGPDNRVALAAKRVIDLTGALVLILLNAPLFLLVALAIKLDDGGPILFHQGRVGQNKRVFTLLKFRTMVQDAESRQKELEALNEASGAVFKIKRDPRITRVGAILRRYSLDELPQLFNVLLGDMSLVGPRPLPLRDVERFEQDWHRRRFSVKPGLTCSWVLSGRSNLSFDRWMELDLEYIDNWSLSRDVSIFLKSIPVIVRGSGSF